MEVDMFARHVSMHLKPNTRAEFTQTIEKEIIPLLRKQQAFQDEITFLAPGAGTEVVGIRLWEQKENAEAYHRGAYQAVLKSLAKVVDVTPEVRNFVVGISIVHKIAAR